MTSPAKTAAANSQTTTQTAGPAGEKPALIASRRHCEADGVGLSHYILMDRAAAPATATPPETV